MFGVASSIHNRLSSRFILRLIDRSTREVLYEYNHFELSSKKTKIVKEHNILK